MLRALVVALQLSVPAVLDRLHERAFVAGYGWVQRRSEAAGMRDLRRALVAGARGTVLEIGAGTGLNLPHYGPAATAVSVVEPAPAMRAVLQQALAELGGVDGRGGPGGVAGPAPVEVTGSAPAFRVVDGTGEALPADDGSVDTVVGTFVLCSVREPEAVLREIARVLRPGGTYLALEHERAVVEGSDRSSASARAHARAQAVVAPAWRFAVRGCRCDQDPVALVGASPLTIESAEHFRGPRQPWPVRPGVRIVARRR